MARVEVFTTLKEAEEKLQIHVSKNRDLVIRTLNELQARIITYRNSADFDKRHPRNKEAALTTEESLLLSKELCRRETIIALVKLYAPSIASLNFNFYAFDYTVFNLNDAITFRPYESVNILAEKVREQLEKYKSEHLGLRTQPVFYTVLEPFAFSEQDKLKAEGYETLSLEDKLTSDKHLDSYVERGLTPAEIKGFIINYTKYFN